MFHIGKLLKGQDFEDKGRIHPNDFYETIKAIPELTQGNDGLKEGDIIDLIRDLEREDEKTKEKYIDLMDFKESVDS